MIRFQPDSWRDALWRPIAMAAPDAGTYVEVIAPDLRFALLLLLLVLGFAIFRRTWQPAMVMWRLLALLGLLFAVWLYTSGNGRYFIAGLMLVGVACLSVIHRWPCTKSLKLMLAFALCGLQAYVVYLAGPFEGAAFAPWREAPAFPLVLPPSMTDEPATYVTLSTNAYSLIAPRVHPDSRWVNLAIRQAGLDSDTDGFRIKEILSGSKRIRALLAGVSGMLSAEGRLSQEFINTMNERLSPLHLAFDSSACSYITFTDASRLNVLGAQSERAEGVVVPGFMLCKLTYVERVQHTPERASFPPEVDQVMAVMDRQCHRFFDSRVGGKYRVPHGTMVHYADADMKLFVFDDRRVQYRYWRSLMAQPLGSVDQVLRSDFTFDCGNIRGRSGLPWERRY